MSDVLRIGRKDETGATFLVQRTLVALKMVASAAEVEPLDLPFSNDGEMTPAALGLFAVAINEQIAMALANQGSLTVRYLGDLKPSVYPIDTHFFRINPQAGGEDDNFVSLLKRALLSGDKQDMTFINLANVRDVKIHVGNSHVLNVSADLAYLSRMVETFELWDKDPCTVCLLGKD